MESDICCCWYFLLSLLLFFQACHFFLFPLKWHGCWNTDICAVRGALCLSHSLSLRVQLRGLVCAWVPRIMITAAEKHISGDKGRQSASRGLNQLPVAYCGANRKVTTNNQATPLPIHKQEEYPQLSFCCAGNQSDWNDTKITFRRFSKYELTMSPIALPSNFVL